MTRRVGASSRWLHGRTIRLRRNILYSPRSVRWLTIGRRSRCLPAVAAQRDRIRGADVDCFQVAGIQVLGAHDVRYQHKDDLVVLDLFLLGGKEILGRSGICARPGIPDSDLV